MPSLPALLDLIVARALRAESTTVPLAPGAEGAPAAQPRAFNVREEPMELRASPRFDSTEALARLPAFSAEGELARTHGDSSQLPLPRARRRIDAAQLATVVVCVLAALVAVVIAVG